MVLQYLFSSVSIGVVKYWMERIACFMQYCIVLQIFSRVWIESSWVAILKQFCFNHGFLNQYLFYPWGAIFWLRRSCWIIWQTAMFRRTAHELITSRFRVIVRRTQSNSCSSLFQDKSAPAAGRCPHWCLHFPCSDDISSTAAGPSPPAPYFIPPRALLLNDVPDDTITQDTRHASVQQTGERDQTGARQAQLTQPLYWEGTDM
jgi:hypothetical protein